MKTVGLSRVRDALPRFRDIGSGGWTSVGCFCVCSPVALFSMSESDSVSSEFLGVSVVVGQLWESGSMDVEDFRLALRVVTEMMACETIRD